MGAPYDEGYPASEASDLDPGPDVTETLDDADRDAVAEQRFSPEGRRPDGCIEDEDRFEDAHDADALDDAAVRSHLGGGSGPVDSANFNDSAAEWSRARV